MRRKIIKQGNNALTLTLPRKWTEQQNVKAGDEIDIEEIESALVISSSYNQKSKEISLILTTTKEYHIRSIIASCYKEGYGIIKLTCKKPVTPKTLHTIISSFTGLEITSQTKNTYEIRCFLRIDTEDCTQLIMKMFHTAQYISTLVNSTQNNENEIKTLVELSVRKLRDHTLRAISTLKFGAEKSYEYYDIVTVLEKIAASYKRMAQSLNKKGNKKLKQLPDVIKHFNLLYKAYLSRDFTTASNAYLKQIDLREEYFTLLSTQTKNKEFVAHAYHISQLYVHLASRIMSLY
tara:strand:+ start:192 stop:1067 length:876 start_codon:yes stop_codon:yes gene_type:complete